MYLNIYNNIPKYILIFFPITLITGPFLIDLCLILIGILSIKKIILTKNFLVFKNQFFIISIIWCIYIIINSSFSDYPKLSYGTSLFFIRYILGIIGIKIFLDEIVDDKFYKKIFIVWSTIFFIIFIDSLIQYFSGYNIFLFVKPINRVSSFFFEEYILGHYLFKLYPIFLFIVYYYDKNIFEKYFNLISLFFFLIIFISGEREALLRFAVLFLLISIYFFQIKKLIKFILLFSIIIISINLINNSSFERIFITSAEQFSKKEVLFYTKGHTNHAIAALELFKEKPLFGHGLKTFREKCKTINIKFCSTHPHNIFFQLLAEVGIIGIIFYIILIVFLISKIINQFKYNDKKIITVLYMGILINIIAIFPNPNLFSNWHAVLLSLTPGFLLYEYYKK